eukprot:1932571-Prymnesium_polylepis.1
MLSFSMRCMRTTRPPPASNASRASSSDRRVRWQLWATATCSGSSSLCESASTGRPSPSLTRTCSTNPNRPPGTRTRSTSASAASTSDTEHSVREQSTASKLSSAMPSRLVASPC